MTPSPQPPRDRTLLLGAVYLFALALGAQVVFLFLLGVRGGLSPFYLITSVGAGVLGVMLYLASAPHPSRSGAFAQIERVWMSWAVVTVLATLWTAAVWRPFAQRELPPGPWAHRRLEPLTLEKGTGSEAKVLSVDIRTFGFVDVVLICDDDVEREMECDPPEPGRRAACRCLTNGVRTRQVRFPDWAVLNDQQAVDLMNRTCGWKTQPR